MHLLPLCLAKWIGILKTPAFVVSHFMYNTQYANSKLKKLFIKFERWLVYRTIDKISFASPNLLSVAQQDYNVPKRHLNTCYWGANMHYFDSTKFSEPARRDIYIGVGGTNRDYDTLTQAFSGMSNCKCEIYAKYNNTNKARVLPDNLAFVNLMTGHTMNDAFKLLRDKYYHCKAVLIPIKTINDVPNGATVLVEALAMGRPVIITKSATNYIDVEKEGIGLTVEQGDVNGWINAVTYLENHPEELKAMSLRAYEFAVKHYNDDNFSKIIYLQMADTVRPK